MRFVISIILIALAVPAVAQEPRQLTPSEVAVAIDNNVNALATALENANRTIADLQKQLADAKAQCEKKQ